MRRRRGDNRYQDANRPDIGADRSGAGYQFDAPARTPYSPYEAYEMYEEYAELPPPPQGRPRGTVVMPAVTLPSVPTVQTPEGRRVPQHRAPGWRRTGGPDLTGEPVEPEPDESWLTDNSSAKGRASADRSKRGAKRQPAAPAHDPAEAGWHDTPTGQWSAARGSGARWAAPPHADAPSPYASHTGVRPSLAPRPQNHHHRLTHAERIAPVGVAVIPPAAARPAGRARRLTQRFADVVFIPAARHIMPRPIRTAFLRSVGLVGAIARRPALASAVVLAVLLLGILADFTGAAQQAGIFSANAWSALGAVLPSGNAALSGAVTAPASYDSNHFMQKYGFFQPGAPTAIGSDESARLVQMLPAAIRAAATYDKRYHKSIEPQMLLYWTHAEGIRGRINYSNCANQDTRPGTSYFTDIENCNHANFWQLGYGNQFGVIYVLRNAFTDLYGDPNDTQLVAKVGQWVLDFDTQAGATPPCGGYSCTFPAKTIDDILSGVNLRTGVVAENNWWASVLSRDPAINCYMIAHALTYFSHEATRNWVGCYYAAPCWQRNSDRLGDILAAWPNLLQAAGIQS
jgi:hypothetical protein